MDRWKDIELEKMKVGGNRKAREFFEAQPDWDDSMTISQKYNTKAAALYRDKVIIVFEKWKILFLEFCVLFGLFYYLSFISFLSFIFFHFFNFFSLFIFITKELNRNFIIIRLRQLPKVKIGVLRRRVQRISSAVLFTRVKNIILTKMIKEEIPTRISIRQPLSHRRNLFSQENNMKISLVRSKLFISISTKACFYQFILKK